MNASLGREVHASKAPSHRVDRGHRRRISYLHSTRPAGDSHPQSSKGLSYIPDRSNPNGCTRDMRASPHRTKRTPCQLRETRHRESLSPSSESAHNLPVMSREPAFFFRFLQVSQRLLVRTPTISHLYIGSSSQSGELAHSSEKQVPSVAESDT